MGNNTPNEPEVTRQVTVGSIYAKTQAVAWTDPQGLS